MKCYYHEDREIVATCTECGKGLCKACASKWDPVLCDDCAAERLAEKRASLKRTIGLGVLIWAAAIVIGIVAAIKNASPQAILIGVLYGYMLGGVPNGWAVLTKLQPSMFLFLPMVGWVIYFVIKFVLAMVVGLVAFPMNLYRFWQGNKQVEEMERHLGGQ